MSRIKDKSEWNESTNEVRHFSVLLGKARIFENWFKITEFDTAANTRYQR